MPTLADVVQRCGLVNEGDVFVGEHVGKTRVLACLGGEDFDVVLRAADVVAVSWSRASASSTIAMIVPSLHEPSGTLCGSGVLAANSASVFAARTPLPPL